MFAPAKLSWLPLFKHIVYIELNPKLCNFAWCKKVALATLFPITIFNLVRLPLSSFSPLFKTLQ
jgi:hypothetical protein